MKVVTRFAPTCSGNLHIGSLYNALLNYLYAKKHDGQFKLRLDRITLDKCEQQYQKNIEEDLHTFGLVPDEVLRASDRREHYTQKAYELSKHERSYCCDCTVQDLLQRASIDDANFVHLYRPEKYPPYCKICQVQVFDIASEEAIPGCGAYSSFEAQGHPVSTILTRQPKAGQWWEPFDVGYVDNPTNPFIRIDLPRPQKVRGIKIVWKDRPALHYRVCLGANTLVEVKKSGKYFVEHKQGHSFLPLQYDVHNFAPVETASLTLEVVECAHPIDRPYFYDYHCRSGGKKLDLNDKNAVLRLRADNAFSVYDTAYWYGQEPNLVLTSVVDDAELGVTHCIRGVDIQPWLEIEGQVALALNTPARQQHFHGLVINLMGYKYSKWIESTPIREYKIRPDKLIAYLANKAKIVKKKVTSLEETVREYTGEIPTKHVKIWERAMLEELRG